MKYLSTGEYEEILDHVSIEPFNKEFDVNSFDCGISDYNDFLKHDANYYQEKGISSVHLLIHNDSKDIIGYFALLTDAFLLDKEEKGEIELEIPFSSVPALKIGKLAVSKNHQEYHYGSFILFMCLGYAEALHEKGIACRFLTVDADIEFNEETPRFYESNGFDRNLHRQQKRKKSVSLRYDIYN
ncbi:hypothetical protein [Alkalihalophilus marmarensis]|uniref:hypothetical protein n=1 Tax=Alkalihalophilus marmarensis TaxID=521377 RepID=UPI002E1D0D62|nr:hypothetical protein [Alkalihalophilus marmarensis]